MAINLNFTIKDIATWGLVLFVITQGFLLSKKFSNAFDLAEEMKGNLEQEVKKRTMDLELQAIELEDLMEKVYYQKLAREDLLSHIGDAYMVFNKKGVVQDGSNRKSELLFECSLFESEAKKIKIWDILRLQGDQLETFQKWIDKVFKGPMKFKDLLPFAPKQFIDNHFIELTFRPIYISEKDNRVDKVICIGSDKTKEKLLEEKMEKDRQKVEFVQHCLRNPVEFIDLIDDLFDFLEIGTNLKPKIKRNFLGYSTISKPSCLNLLLKSLPLSFMISRPILWKIKWI